MSLLPSKAMQKVVGETRSTGKPLFITMETIKNGGAWECLGDMFGISATGFKIMIKIFY